MTNVAPPATPDDALRAVDELVAAGRPAPEATSVREEPELALSLTLHTRADLDAWSEHLDTVGAVDPEPWPVGGREYRVAVGRLAGLRTVLVAPCERSEAA